MVRPAARRRSQPATTAASSGAPRHITIARRGDQLAGRGRADLQRAADLVERARHHHHAGADHEIAGQQRPSSAAAQRGAAFERHRRTCSAPGFTMLVGLPLMKLTTLSKACAEVQLVAVLLDVADVRRADAVLQPQQRVALQRSARSRTRRPRPCPGRPRLSAASSASGSTSSAREVLTNSAVGFMRERSSSVTMPRVSSVSRRCRPTARRAASKKSSRLGGHLEAVGPRLGASCLAAPDHAPACRRPGRSRATSWPMRAVAPDAERLALEHRAQAEVRRHRGRLEARLLPGAVLEVADVLRQAAHRRHDQRPGQLGRRQRRARALGHRDAALGAGVDVDVAADPAGLRDELELGQLLDQLARDLGALADQHDHVGVLAAAPRAARCP